MTVDTIHFWAILAILGSGPGTHGRSVPGIAAKQSKPEIEPGERCRPLETTSRVRWPRHTPEVERPERVVSALRTLIFLCDDRWIPSSRDLSQPEV